jgi:perosamine synthetase
MSVPFFRPEIGREERAAVDRVLQSGWLTSGPMTQEFESKFAAAVGARHAVALNSCTAALHLAVEALGLGPGDAVLVPTMTFAASAEIVRYRGAYPILVDCVAETCNIDLADAERKMQRLREGGLPGIPRQANPKGIIPVHVGGLMCDIRAISEFARANGLWVVEDAAHAFPAAWRERRDQPWRKCGEATADVTCFSFYANKTITTGEGGMAVCGDESLARRMRLMCLHGLSHDAWGRYNGTGTWDYRIVAPGYKYNMADPLAAIGVEQLRKAETLRRRRSRIAAAYLRKLRGVEQLMLPSVDKDRIHSWHLFPIRVRSESLAITRDAFIQNLKLAGIGTSVHWRPLHLHPYYQQAFGWTESHCPVASAVWATRISLPLYPGMTQQQADYVAVTVRNICEANAC